MPCFYLRLSILHSPVSLVRQDHFWKRFGYAAEYRRFPLITVKSDHNISMTRNFLTSCSLIRSFPNMDVDIDVDEMSDIAKCRDSLSGKEVLDISRRGSLETHAIEDVKKTQRREKMGLINKEKVQWNKGKQQDEETCEHIKQRTIEALKNPKVGQKMAEWHHSRSDQAKNKISSSLKLKRVWGTRLKCKGTETKFFCLWAESIAEAAKTGGPEQEALDWDSYDKINEELGQKQLHMDAEKEHEKALAKIRSMEKAAWVRAKKMEVAQKRKLREERKKKKEEMTEERRKLRLERRDSKQKLKLKERLSQIRLKISRDSQICSQKGVVSPHTPALEKLDLELIKSENSRRDVSLEDQIKAAKSKKAEFANGEAPESSLSVPFFVENHQLIT